MSKREKIWALVIGNVVSAVIILFTGWCASTVSQVLTGMVLIDKGVSHSEIEAMFNLWDRLPIMALLWAIGALISMPLAWFEIGVPIMPPPPPSSVGRHGEQP